MVDKNSLSYRKWPSFYDHPFIKTIADKPKWSISTSDKMPVDMLELSKGKIVGCKIDIPHSMATLSESVDIVENNFHSVPANHAFLMDVDLDGFILVDVEPKCPTNLKKKFMSMPYLYGERSLSGKGFHFILPVPAEYYEYPDLAKLQKMQDKNRYFEIMFSHWVTFTRNQLVNKNDIDFSDLSKFECNDFFKETFAKLASEQRSHSSEGFAFEYDSEKSISEIQGGEEVMAVMLNPNANLFDKGLADYDNDYSRFSFAIGMHYYNHMVSLMNGNYLKDVRSSKFSPQEKAILLHAIVKNFIPPRAKNDSKRGDVTWLMYQCQKIVSMMHDADGNEIVENKKG